MRYDKMRYRDGLIIENAFCRLRDFPGIATRYGKVAANFFSTALLAATSSPSGA